MKDYVREEECKFYVNKEKRTVVCVYEQSYDLVSDIMMDRLEIISHAIERVTEIPTRFVGIAVCAPEDTWNEEIGRRVAFLKMRRKYYRCFFNAINRGIDYVDNTLAKMVDEFNNFGDKIENSINREQERLQKVITESNE